MKNMIAILSAAFILLPGFLWAHEGVATSHRDAIQSAMKKNIVTTIDHNANGKFPIYDSGLKAVIQLQFKNLHDSVEVMGRENPYFISCADFVDDKGVLYDLDFLLSKKYEVVAVLIHAKNGKKIHYNIN